MSDETEKKDEVKAEAEVAVPSKFKKLVEEVENMSVLELNELVKVLEKKFGVSASAVAVAAPAGGADATNETASTTKSVELKKVGEQKIQVIKALKEALGLGLKEAKDMTEAAPTMVKEGMKTADAEALKAKLEAAGATIELK